MTRVWALGALLGLTFAMGAAAQTRQFDVTINPMSSPEGYGKISIDKAAVGSTQIRLWAITSVEPDCTPHGPTTLTLERAPDHGTVTISDDPFFFSFQPQSNRAACSQHKVPGHQAFYTAIAGYTGHDKAVFQASDPDGHVRRITVNIDVR